MDKIVICIGALALAGSTAWGQNDMQSSNGVTPRAVHRQSSTVQRAAPTVRRSNVTHRQLAATEPSIPRVPRRQTNLTRERNSRQTGQALRTRSDITVNRERNTMVTRNRSAMVNHSQNAVVNRNQNVTINRNQSRISFNEAVNLHRQEFHDRDWWRRHFQIVIINNNAFFFDAGFWFPAWGYFPGAYYPYAGPIYGYNGLMPDQVVVNVQAQLQRDGYYAGPIDGVLGPMTRNAIAAFQTDHGLAVTAAIDGETVSTLGLA
jgi:Putative peptidoglycan binding domain